MITLLRSWLDARRFRAVKADVEKRGLAIRDGLARHHLEHVASYLPFSKSCLVCIKQRQAMEGR